MDTHSLRNRRAFSLSLCLLVGSLASVLSFQTPEHKITRSYLASTALSAAISSGDKVLVLGGTGGVGQLTISKLRNRGDFKVGTATRNKKKAQEVIADNEVEIYQVDLLSDDTTNLEAAMDGAAALVISVGTTAFPTPKWNGGNTPKAIDEEAVVRTAAIASRLKSMKKIVMVTSVGVERTGEMPFLVLNLFGVLDAKKKGEEAVKDAAAKGGFDYVVIRPGRLVGGPFTNLDIAKLLQVEGGAENGVTIQAGDTLLGDCKRDACAEAVVQSLLSEDCKDVEFSMVSNEEKALNDDEWAARFREL